jgi:hypothetical protein
MSTFAVTQKIFIRKNGLFVGIQVLYLYLIVVYYKKIIVIEMKYLTRRKHELI